MGRECWHGTPDGCAYCAGIAIADQGPDGHDDRDIDYPEEGSR